ncbi:Hypothetical_protein [Hexamita inflata]|uniref:Hypothetical_protein n=1 Tax=Hexamita inflata TaxID=28002 RepID=A0ABP1JAQ0_9EUKA
MFVKSDYQLAVDISNRSQNMVTPVLAQRGAVTGSNFGNSQVIVFSPFEHYNIKGSFINGLQHKESSQQYQEISVCQYILYTDSSTHPHSHAKLRHLLHFSGKQKPFLHCLKQT